MLPSNRCKCQRQVACIQNEFESGWRQAAKRLNEKAQRVCRRFFLSVGERAGVRASVFQYASSGTAVRNSTADFTDDTDKAFPLRAIRVIRGQRLQ